MLRNLIFYFILLAPVLLSGQDELQSIDQPITSGLLFERGENRGSGFIDSLGIDYSLRYFPMTITNDSTIPIHVHLEFLAEYKYALEQGDVVFKVIPLLIEWARDQTTDHMFDRIFKGLAVYVYEPVFNETVQPGETFKLGIANLVVRPRDISISINAPFA